MKKTFINPSFFILFLIICYNPYVKSATSPGPLLHLNDSSYFQTVGLDVLVFNNWYNGMFSDSKISGIEMIHHGVRTVTNGDVRLNPTPEQWDPIPAFIDRKIDKKENSIEAFLHYPDYNFKYSIAVQPKDSGFLIQVKLDKPLPDKLKGIAGFNLEFLPAAYFEKAYIMDGKSDIFPLYPSEAMERTSQGAVDPQPLATGNYLALAPEDAHNRITIKSNNKLMLYDGRNKAQNGWYVVRSLIPSDKTGTVIEWYVDAAAVPGWIRKPVIGHSQVGYQPQQQKVAVIELDKNDTPLTKARLLKINEKGIFQQVLENNIKDWGQYQRYHYVTFDFTSEKEQGLYAIEYGNTRTKPFRIAKDVYKDAWHPTLDIYLPVQMDHVYVKEAYRVWHGASHLDDALQAPVNHEHFDLYSQGPETGTKYKPLEHIPGLNVGGWYDAGDFDIRTQTQYAVVLSLVQSREDFGLKRDETSVNEKNRQVFMHVPDGTPDIIQQIEHGTLQLLAQHKAVGHAINGIICAHLSQYTHLGDGVTKTDNLIYNPALDSFQTDGFTSGTFDDRWAFTNKSTPLNYGSIAALAAASRVLKGYNDTLATECLATAKKVWADEHSHKPDLFRFGNTTGGPLEMEELKAAVQLLKSTGDDQYAQRIKEMWPEIAKNFNRYAGIIIQAVPLMGNDFKEKMRPLVKEYAAQFDKFKEQNPYGVYISTGGWAGSGQVVGMAITNYQLYRQFPDLISPDQVFRGLNYIYGCHPASNISFVSGVGTVSKKVAYGNNRADFSFIAGGVVPGVLILKPDFPENKEDWPFFWGENEYVVNLGASYIYLVNAANSLTNDLDN